MPTRCRGSSATAWPALVGHPHDGTDAKTMSHISLHSRFAAPLPGRCHGAHMQSRFAAQMRGRCRGARMQARSDAPLPGRCHGTHVQVRFAAQLPRRRHGAHVQARFAAPLPGRCHGTRVQACLLYRCQGDVTDYCAVAKATTRLCCTTVRTTSRRAMQGGIGHAGRHPVLLRRCQDDDAILRRRRHTDVLMPCCCAAAKITSRPHLPLPRPVTVRRARRIGQADGRR